MYGGRSFSPKVFELFRLSIMLLYLAGVNHTSSRGTSGFECPAKRSLDIIGLELRLAQKRKSHCCDWDLSKLFVAEESKGDDRRGKIGRDDKVDKIENSEDK